MVLTLGAAGCAPARNEAVRAERAPLPTAPGGGVIVSMRPMSLLASDAILIALNTGGVAHGARATAAVEFMADRLQWLY